MTQRKPDGEHSGGRRKSETRQRGQQVHVRFSNDEYGTLLDASRRTGIPAARLLREAFLLAEATDLVGRIGADHEYGEDGNG